MTQLLELDHRTDTARKINEESWLLLGWSSSGPVAVWHKRGAGAEGGTSDRGCLRFATAVRSLWNSSNSLCAAVSFLQLLSVKNKRTEDP